MKISLLFFAFCLLFSSAVSAQDKNRELGIGTAALFIETKDTVIQAYHARYHLSGTDFQYIGYDTIEISRMYYFDGEGKKRYTGYESKKYYTNNCKCFFSYYETEIPCSQIGL